MIGSNPYKISLLLQNKPHEWEMDTGAGRSIMSGKKYKENSKERPVLNTTVKLKTYSGELLKIMDKIDLTIEHEAQVINAEVIVIEGDGPTLLGRDIITKLNWSTVYKVEPERIPNELLAAKIEEKI